MRVVYKAPGESAKTLNVPNTISALREMVGGNYAIAYRSEHFAILCNEKEEEMEYNNIRIGEYEICGPVVAVGISGKGKACGLDWDSAYAIEEILRRRKQ